MSARQPATTSVPAIQFGSPSQFFDLSDPGVADLFAGCEYVWDSLTRLKEILRTMVDDTTVVHGTVMAGAYVAPAQVYIDEGACVEPGAFVNGPCYIGPGVEVRHGAYIRGSVILLRESIVGHATEVKNSILLPNAKAPHFAYLGDSILGSRVNLGAGTKLSNVMITSAKDRVSGQRPSIVIPAGGEQYDTGLSKLGAILGDDCQTGCNSVLNPGAILEPGCLVYPNASVSRGHYPAGTIIKLRQKIEYGTRRDGRG
jgi:UDP-N-acetylglucosamine diphosphorylase / glucose-1-phosphate thymidylyltransferase / UDP-N-acetylgalactosamine diphosphorylase / glucosamine-1-phosphate N-acetyltransferase / galactosamine-1-phosphate N-acetyltransferase